MAIRLNGSRERRNQGPYQPPNQALGAPLTSVMANGVLPAMSTVSRQTRLWWRTL
jgi:hypothetical protein